MAVARLQDRLERDIKQRLKPNPHKVRADVEMKCYSFAGVQVGTSAVQR